ncbi:MAG: DUF2934 domain-containing protein [Verrucomicrobia bacterium]|nr:DUF2934 domain-containing protein [Verrucomicrobiota bacterium]
MKTKTKKNNAPKPNANGSNGKPAADDIALAAYCIWEQEGRLAGHDVENWLRAETLLLQAQTPATFRA